jgi:hypothetical protein
MEDSADERCANPRSKYSKSRWSCIWCVCLHCVHWWLLNEFEIIFKDSEHMKFTVSSLSSPREGHEWKCWTHFYRVQGEYEWTRISRDYNFADTLIIENKSKWQILEFSVVCIVSSKSSVTKGKCMFLFYLRKRIKVLSDTVQIIINCQTFTRLCERGCYQKHSKK